MLESKRRGKVRATERGTESESVLLSRHSRFGIAGVALGSGFSVMVLELAAVRVFAPHFGDSVPVWTNVIGVILLGLALGAWIGGVFADRGQGRKILPWLLGAAGGLSFLVPFLVPRIANWILPESLPLHLALPILVEGSLGASLFVFLPPVLLLGAVPPVLIRMGSLGDQSHVGRISGTVYSSGTLGSLAGTFLTTHWLIPTFGLSYTFAISGCTLILVGVLSSLLSKGPRVPPALAVLFFPFCFMGKPSPIWLEKGKLLAEVTSPYQELFVKETVEGGTVLRELKINEGLDSFHSVFIEGNTFTNGRYYDAFALLPFLFESRPLSVLSLGCGAGTILRCLQGTTQFPIKGLGVELDPQVLTLGRSFFSMGQLEKQGNEFLGGLDARIYVNHAKGSNKTFDLICLDTYRNQFYLPAHLASLEFFQKIKAILREDGIFALNVGDFREDGPVLSAIAQTLARVFYTVESFRVKGERNFLLMAHQGNPLRLWKQIQKVNLPKGFPSKIWAAARRDLSFSKWEAGKESDLLRDYDSPLLLLHERMYERLR
jgi:spermidine synthase